MKFEEAKLIITESGHHKLKVELHQLVTVARIENLKNLRRAREQGDLSENSDFDAAKKEQGHIEERIAVLKRQLELAVIDVSKSRDVVKIGTCISFQYVGFRNNAIDEIQIVGAFETDVFSKPRKIAYNSVFAQLLLNKSNSLAINDIVVVPSEKLKYSIKILSIT